MSIIFQFFLLQEYFCCNFIIPNLKNISRKLLSMNNKVQDAETKQSYVRINEDVGTSIQETTSNQVAEETKTLLKPYKGSSFKRLLRYTYKHRLLLVFANLGLLVTSLSLVAIPKIIDAISKKASQSEFNNLAIQFIALTIIGAIFGFIRGACYNVIGEKVVVELRNELFQKLIEKDIEFYDQIRSGELISHLTSDISVIQSGASDTISMLIRNTIQFIGSIILLWLISWRLTLVLLCVIPPFLLFDLQIINICRYFKQYTKQYQDLLAKSTQVASEVLGNMRIVRSFSTERKESSSYGYTTQEAYQVGRKRAILAGMFAGIGMGLGYAVLLAILYYGGSLVLNGILSVGELSSFILYTTSLTVSVLTMSGTMNQLVQASALAEKVFSLMDCEIKIINGTIVVENEQNFKGQITFKNVSFAYPTKPSVVVLKSMSLHIKAGEVVAFVGMSGSGKSTIVSLLERFYDPTSGEIEIDGMDIKSYDIKQQRIIFLHKEIGFVSQEPTLFSGTLEENISYGVEKYTREDIDTALKLANAYEFVSNKDSFPEGLKTVVGERGVKLSGGQKQRIAIARALIKNPKILIFDEATSALDAESEYQVKVQQAIDGLMTSGSKTIIIIAHRLSTIINCNKIVVIQKGEIAELGTHQELLQKGGVYKALIERQLS